MAKQKVALDCLSYHASASQADTDALAKADIPSAAKYSLHRYVILVYDSLAGYNISSIFLLVVRVEIDSITAKHASHRKVDFNEFVQNSLCRDTGRILS